jgi:hypothetical protein
MGGKLNTIKDSFIDVFQTKALDILTGPNGFITKGINVLMGALDGLINKITGGVGGALSQTFGGGIPGIGTGTSSIPGVPGVPGVPSGGSGPAGTAGSAGGALGIINAVTGVGTLVSSIFGNFQQATTNERLKLIEEQVRRSAQFLGDRGDGGITQTLFRVLEQLEFGNLVVAVEDFRNKFWDNAIPSLRALEVQGAYVQPTLDHFGSQYFGPWGDKFDAIARNTERTALAVERMGPGGGSSLNTDALATAFERNEGGLATRTARVLRQR